MKVNLDRRELFKPLIENEISESKNNFSLNKILKDYGKEAYKQSLRISIFEEIQGTIDGTNLLTIIKNGTRDDLIELLWAQHRDIQILETEIYNIKNGGRDEIENAFYGSISNEKITLFELIEEYIK